MATKAKKKAKPTAKSVIRALRAEIRVYRAELKESLDHIAKLERLAEADALILKEARRRTIPFRVGLGMANFLPLCITSIEQKNNTKTLRGAAGFETRIASGAATVTIESEGEIVINE